MWARQRQRGSSSDAARRSSPTAKALALAVLDPAHLDHQLFADICVVQVVPDAKVVVEFRRRTVRRYSVPVVKTPVLSDRQTIGDNPNCCT